MMGAESKVHASILIVLVELRIGNKSSLRSFSGNESKNKTFTEVQEL